MRAEILIKVLEKSVEKHGAIQTVTMGHLLNLIRVADRLEKKTEEERELFESEINNEFWEDEMRYGSGDE